MDSKNILAATVNRDRAFMLPLYITHIRPLLEYSSSLWNLGYVGDLKLLESVQRRWTKSIRGLEELEYAVRLRALNLFSVKGRLLRHDIIKIWQIFHGKCAISPDDLFTPPYSGTRGHQFKVALMRRRRDLCKRFFNIRCVTLWNSLPASLVSIQNLDGFKNALPSHLGDLLFDYHQ